MNARGAFLAAARERILVFDGAFGTQIQARRLGEADYAGKLALSRDQAGNNDILALTRPDVIADITRAVKLGEKAIALNEVRDMAQRLNLLAEALAPRPVPASPVSEDAAPSA